MSTSANNEIKNLQLLMCTCMLKGSPEFMQIITLKYAFCCPDVSKSRCIGIIENSWGQFSWIVDFLKVDGDNKFVD